MPQVPQGAKGDGQASDTAAIQAAIDTCGGRPSGGVVLLEPDRTYLTGTLRLASGVRLHIPVNATLLADLQVRGLRARWSLVAFLPGLRCTHATPYVPQRSQYQPSTGDDWHLVLLKKCTRCSVEGGGRIDGRGAAWGCATPLLAPAAEVHALGNWQSDFWCMHRHANAESEEPCESRHACGPKLVGIIEASQV